LQTGDIIESINGTAVKDNVSLGSQVDLLSSEEVKLSVVRDNKEIKIALRPKVEPSIGVARIGIIFGRLGIYSVKEGSVADKAGLSRGDTDIAMIFSNDLKTTYLSWNRVVNGKVSRVKPKEFATPENIVKSPSKFGITGKLPLGLYPVFQMDKADGLMAAVKQAIPKTLNKTLAIYGFMKKLIFGKVNITAAGGPIIIFKTMYAYAELGFGKLLDIAAFISINLAVLNILPLPVLDGGHLFFLLIELIKGSQPSAKVREYAQYAGFFFLMGLMLLVTAFDVYYSWLQ
jgi:regulator of sigma E protease